MQFLELFESDNHPFTKQFTKCAELLTFSILHITSVTFCVCNWVQHRKCLQGETFWKQPPFSPFVLFFPFLPSLSWPHLQVWPFGIAIKHLQLSDDTLYKQVILKHSETLKANNGWNLHAFGLLSYGHIRKRWFFFLLFVCFKYEKMLIKSEPGGVRMEWPGSLKG